jgi:hypothetical protein
MGTVHLLFENDDAIVVSQRGAVSATSFHEPLHDEFFEVMSGLLEEPAIVPNGDPAHQPMNDDATLLREANARLRALAIQLSNLVGDLPVLR